MRVRIFSSESAEQLESQINDFFESGDYGEIRDIKFSVGATSASDGRGQSDPMALFSALIYYREKQFFDK